MLQIPRDTLTAIERAAVTAWPALETMQLEEGWLWRHSGGGSQRANSVSPRAFSGVDVERAIADVEARYRARGAAPMFQICDVIEPADLDDRLARRGYRLQEPCTCLAKPIATASLPDEIECSEIPSKDWLTVYLAGVSESRRATAPLILARVPRPRVFILARRGGRPVSTALGVVAERVVIAECVATLGHERRSGGAARVMQALEAWGAGEGATIAALQAVAANAPAQALYAKLDYHSVGSYHYRVIDA